MKELSIEEKASRYDKAIKVAQRFYNNSVAITKKGLEEMFSEIAESEDERIRKGIIRNLKYLADKAQGFVKDELEERIAWLESLKDRVGCEANCTTTKEWSEEDKEYLRRAINATKNVYPMTADWLKSLKKRLQK